MTRQDYLHLQGERTFLKQQLEVLPADAQLTRRSTEARLRSVEEQLAKAPGFAYEPARALLLYRGRPVVGNHGIFAEFGTKATNAFLDGVAKFGAAQTGPLAPTGPIPNREQVQFLITSTAPGSFGFELEEHRSGQLPFGDASPAAQALEQLRQFLQSTLETDDELAEAVAGADPRAVEAVRAFLEILVVNEAVCSLQCGDRDFRFHDVGQVRRSLGRLSSDNLHEEEKVLEGEFQGLLPKRRSFEFKLSASDEIIGGKVAPAVENLDNINLHLGLAARIRVKATQAGNGRPRYVLIAAPEWSGAREQSRGNME